MGHVQAVASKLHGVEVDIKIIKRKGDPIASSTDVENSCKAQQVKNEKKSCPANKYDTNIHSNNNSSSNNNTQVPSNDSLCGKCESKHKSMKMPSLL